MPDPSAGGVSPPPLPRAFFERSPLDVAPDLIGTLLCRRTPDGELLAVQIVETEAYLGPQDRASHARAGSTARTAPMFGAAGHAYVYRLYGMHWAFNVVARTPEQAAGAVLVRAGLPVAGAERQRARRGRPHDAEARLASGPGRLCQALAITGADSGRDLTGSASLWIEAGPGGTRGDLLVGPRVNVGYAEAWAALPYRFGLAGSPALSRPFAGPTPIDPAESIPGGHHPR